MYGNPKFGTDAQRLVLFSGHNLALSTVSTGEEILKTVTLPAGILNTNLYSGFAVKAMFKASGGADNKTPRLRLGSIGGPAIWQQTISSANNRWYMSTEMYIQGTDLLMGIGQQTISSGTTSGNIYAFEDIAATFSSAIPILVTGQSTVGGGLTLNYLSVSLIDRIV